MKHLKNLTILHSNDLHGEFFPTENDNGRTGGVSMLSGYIQKMRKEGENVLYCVAGDMFRGSIIDSEYKGLSTVEIMNLIAPDVFSLGNHEVDYGLAHLLFLEKCARFPIINANMYITLNHRRLFTSHIIKDVDGMRILFIGILTEDVLGATKGDSFIGTLVDIAEAAREVGTICNVYRTIDIDFTILMTHVGIESDMQLAASLDPRWGVDLIIGGHSHTFLDAPVTVSGIPIAHAGYGTSQIGRFDITVNTDTNSIENYTWKLIPIDEAHCPVDDDLENVIMRYKNETDEKYRRIVTRFANCYTHPVRNTETMLGKLMADAFKDVLEVDIMLLGSGSIRRESLGPVVTYRDLLEVLPYSDAIYAVTLTGSHIRNILKYLLRDESFSGHTEFFQFSRGFRVEYDKKSHELISVSLNGYEITDKERFSVGLQNYHLINAQTSLGFSLEELSEIKKPRLLSTTSTDIASEYFSRKELIRASSEKRLIIT